MRVPGFDTVLDMPRARRTQDTVEMQEAACAVGGAGEAGRRAGPGNRAEAGSQV